MRNPQWQDEDRNCYCDNRRTWLEKLEERTFNEKAPNAVEEQTGCDVPARLLGFVTVSNLHAGVHVVAIEQEVVTRNVSDPDARNHTAKKSKC